MSGIFKSHQQIRERIDAECQRLGFDDQMKADLAFIVCGRPNKLTLPMLKALLIELQSMDENGDQLHPDSPLARYYETKRNETK